MTGACPDGFSTHCSWHRTHLATGPAQGQCFCSQLQRGILAHCCSCSKICLKPSLKILLLVAIVLCFEVGHSFCRRLTQGSLCPFNQFPCSAWGYTMCRKGNRLPAFSQQLPWFASLWDLPSIQPSFIPVSGGS